MMQKNFKQRGFTLIELGIVLALAALAIFFAASKLTSASNQTRAQNFVTDVSQAISSTKRLFATQSDYSTITIDILRDNSVFPSNWKVTSDTGTAINGPWGGAVTAAAADLNGTNDAAKLTVPNLPSEVCSEAVRILAGGIEIIEVAGTKVKAKNAALDLAALGTKCAAANAASVAFTFGRM